MLAQSCPMQEAKGQCSSNGLTTSSGFPPPPHLMTVSHVLLSLVYFIICFGHPKHCARSVSNSNAGCWLADEHVCVVLYQ